MKKNTRESHPKHPKIVNIEVTEDKLTSRAGLALFVRYLDGIGLGWFVARWLGPLRKNSKGQSAAECLRQVLLFLVDGTSRHLKHFDAMKDDEGYAATIEREPEDLLSSHSVKRFFGRQPAERLEIVVPKLVDHGEMRLLVACQYSKRYLLIGRLLDPTR